MSETIVEYFDALERLKAGQPTRVQPGTPINNDSVSLEAGRKVGSIKRGRDVFADLIVAIDLAKAEQSKGKTKAQDKLDAAKQEADRYREAWEAGLARELCLIREVRKLKEQLAALTGGNVLPIRGKAST